MASLCRPSYCAANTPRQVTNRTIPLGPPITVALIHIYSWILTPWITYMIIHPSEQILQPLNKQIAEQSARFVSETKRSNPVGYILEL